jgi:hypothetical protein
VSILPVDFVGPLIENILIHGPVNTALNAAGASVPWKEILEAYAGAWGRPLNWDSRRRLWSFLNFSDPGGQMAAWYASCGAEFPDGILRSVIGWKPEGDWRKTVKAAAETMPFLQPEGEAIPS